MKRITVQLLIIILCLAVLTACSQGASTTSVQDSVGPSETQEPTASDDTDESDTGDAETSGDVLEAARVGALKGPTSMGMVKLMDEVDAGEVTEVNYEFTIAGAIDEIISKINHGELDIAAVPANLASVLYNNTGGQVKVMAINTLGVLYIIESGDTVQSVEDLRGKTIYASGKGATPEYALNYILSENGLNPGSDVNIEWKSEHSECVAALVSDDNAIAMLPQPFATTALNSAENMRMALDLTEEWDKLQTGAEEPSALITGVVVVRSDFVTENPDTVSDFLDRYLNSVDFVNSNVTDAAELIGRYDIVVSEVAEKALPYCNIVFIEGQEMREKLSGYLNVLLEQAPESVGDKLPDDQFYYER